MVTLHFEHALLSSFEFAKSCFDDFKTAGLFIKHRPKLCQCKTGSYSCKTSQDVVISLLVILQALERKNIDKTPLKEAKLPIIWVLGK